MRSKSSFSRYSSKALCRPLMTYSISVSQLCWCTFLDGSGNSCHRFFAKLVPGVDLVPFWTIAVANVYRKSKRIVVTAEQSREQPPALGSTEVRSGNEQCH